MHTSNLSFKVFLGDTFSQFQTTSEEHLNIAKHGKGALQV